MLEGFIMVKKGLNLVLLLMMVFLILTLSGCSKTTHRIYESGFFEYVIVGKTGHWPKNKADQAVAIIRLTELGQEQESIDIPRTIDGKEVWYIGYPIIKGLMAGNQPYPITSSNLKKMYIHDNIISIDNGVFLDWDVMLCSVVYNLNLDSVHGKIYIYKSLYEKALEDLQQSGTTNPWYGEKIFPANIAFLNNYSMDINGGYYRLDNLEAGNKISQPPSPVREGFEFTGWFTEAHCSNIWNFDIAIEIENGDEFRLYAGWQQKK